MTQRFSDSDTAPMRLRCRPPRRPHLTSRRTGQEHPIRRRGIHPRRHRSPAPGEKAAPRLRRRTANWDLFAADRRRNRAAQRFIVRGLNPGESARRQAQGHPIASTSLCVVAVHHRGAVQKGGVGRPPHGRARRTLARSAVTAWSQWMQSRLRHAGSARAR